MNLQSNKQEYFRLLDSKAHEAAKKFLSNTPVTKLILEIVNELYKSSKLDKFEDGNYDAAYHNPITSDFEFYISRFFYNLSHFKTLDWIIHLRRQKNSCTPDIRIEKNGKTLFVVEIKVKAGWIQEIFSDKRFEHDLNRFKKKEINNHPKVQVEKVKNQLQKYSSAFNIGLNKVIVLIASLENVHRKKYSDADITHIKIPLLGTLGCQKKT
jgi:hypothetical protein